ncbi:MAG TPA: flagellar basal body-associated FliL family protein [Acidobacteriaceae bacterium]|jgi:flagellar FliL protein|nr:flagellar basal body-associated FliL family protein [Acidobacteriaceae bacterium]
MATTPKPTILKPPSAKEVTAEQETASSLPTNPKKGKSSLLLWILLVVGIVLLLGLALGGWWWKHHAHVRGGAVAATASKASKSAAPIATVELPLEPFVVNLADAGGHSYARIGLTLHLVAPAAGKDAKKDDAAGASDLRDVARDTIISVLNQQQSADLLAASGKDHLKQILRQAMAARDPRLQVVDIYFTEFLVQP